VGVITTETGLPVVFDTASEHLTSEVPRAAPTDRAGDTRRSLAGRRFVCASDVAVCEGERLVGLVPIEALLAASDDTPLAAVMDANPPVVSPGVDQEVAAWHAVQHHETSLGVVDANGRFLGLIAPERMLTVLLEEHDEDMARLGGFLAGTKRARVASEEPVKRRLWHRLPWLLVGLVGAMVAALLVKSFEKELSETLELAFFIPGIVYMADAVGTQTETIVIRGLSVGVSIRDVVRLELLTGVLVGIALGGLFLPFALLVFEDGAVAVTVALALLASCAVATIIAMALPWVLHRLGRDPAFGSGPLATVIQDLLSILIYFAIALALVR
jgi:magnesium transporter